MAQGIVTPLQLTAAAALLNNQGIMPLPAALTTALNTINATTLYTNFLTAVATYVTQSFANASTLQLLLTIGAGNCPALGNSVPAAYTNLPYVVTDLDGNTQSPYGFTGLIDQTGNAYLGDGDSGRFCQGFMAVQGYISLVNQYINSAVNVQTYLGPTFTNMDALITNNLSNVNPDLGSFGQDLYQQGQLWNLAVPTAYGTPAGLLQQLASVGRLRGGFFGNLQTALIAQGLTAADIQQLIRGQEQLTSTEFNTLQLLAYRAMLLVTGDSLDQILSILDVTLPNINNMADLLNPVKTFPLSYSTLQVPAGTTWQPIYNPGTSVNLAIAPLVNAVLPAASGCDELAKVIPPDQAVANRAIQVSLEQITGLPLTTLPALAETVQSLAAEPWDPDTTYLANEVVNAGSPVLTVYQAQQDVPVGTDITDTNYWLPTTLGGISTLAGLPLLQAQPTPVDLSVTTYFDTQQATGSGVNGTVTTCDVLGTAIDYNNFAVTLGTATANINSLQTAGALAALNTAYTNIAGAVSDAAVLTQISNANAAVAAIVANVTYASQVAALNTAWNTIAAALSQEKTYQTRASLNYFILPTGDQTSVMTFVQQLPQYGLEVADCEAADFLEQIADTTILGGQAIVGVMRESRNNQQLNATQLGQNLRPSSEPAVTPVPVVVPVY